MWKLKVWVLIGLLWLGQGSLPGYAQAESNSYTWPLTGLTVDYPDEWMVDVDATHFGITDGELRVDFYPPEFLPNPPQSTRDVISTMLRNMRFRNEVPTTEVERIEIGTFVGDKINYSSDPYEGFYIGVSLPDDQFWLIDAYRNGRRMDGISETAVLEIINSMRILSGTERLDIGRLALENYALSPQLTIRELQNLRVIPSGGAMVFEQDFAVGDVNPGGIMGDYFGGDIVMGALVAFSRTSQSAASSLCSLIGRASDDTLNNNQGSFLLVALNDRSGEGSILALEFDEATSENESQRYRIGIDPQQTRHLMLIVQDNTVSVFVDGVQVGEPQDLTITTDNNRSWTGFALEPGCVMSDIWAYDLP